MSKSLKKEAGEWYACTNCGIIETNRAMWCDLGCGRDYNKMFIVHKVDILINKATLAQKKKDAIIIGNLKGVADIDVRNGEWLIGQGEAIDAINGQDV
ncbi:MAG TPA: hypothetical protein ENI23_17075 [bacterium]|nr:hypothetical protein [bacterium]